MRKQKNTPNKKKYLVIGVVLVVLAAIGAGIYVYQQRNAEEQESVVADPDFSDGTPREPGTSTEQNGGITPDETENEEPPQTDPITSSSGVITVYKPQRNQLLQSGNRIYGTAKIDTVYYRLIDDKIGVVNQGSLPVKDGKFSGTFEFQTNGTEGRLDIFRMTEDGLEADNVEIDITFQ